VVRRIDGASVSQSDLLIAAIMEQQLVDGINARLTRALRRHQYGMMSPATFI
jgi:hypothetical protein